MVRPPLLTAADAQMMALMPVSTPSSPARERPACMSLVDAAGASGIRSQLGMGRMPSVSQAARARKLRMKSALRRDATLPVNAQGCIEHGKLCREGRACVWKWARGQISGARCLFELEQCMTVINLLKDIRSEVEEEEDALGAEAALWTTGCVRLGGTEQRLKTLRRDLDTKSPDKVLQDAWESVERESGAAADCLEVEEVAAALRRLSERAARRVWDPCAFIRVQVWRELICMQMGGEETGGEEDSDSSPSPGNLRDVDDASVLDWIQMTEEDVRQAAETCSSERLARNAERLLGYAEQVLRMHGRLKKALECWQRFDAYRILGVSRSATLAEVRKAFYRKALIMHPDKGGDKAAFQELQRAYDEIVTERKNAEQAKEAAEESADETAPDSHRTRRPKEQPKDDNAEAGQQASSQQENGDAEQRTADSDDLDDDDLDDVEPEQTQEGASSVGQISRVAKKASAAAARVGERAVDVLRHCYDAMEALEKEPAGLEHGWSGFSCALQVAPGVAEAVGRVAQQVVIMLGLLAGRAFSESMAESTLNTADDSGSEADAKESLEQAVTRASMALTGASASYTTALADASTLSQDQFVDTGAGDCRYIADSLRDSCVSVVDAVKVLAMVALDAAVILADIASHLEAPLLADTESDHGNTANAGEEMPAEGDTTGNLPKEEEARHTQQEEDDDDDEDVHESLRTILEAIHMLRVTNREVLKLQREAQGLAHKDPKAMPQVSVERRQRCFELVTELLDEAALQFHEQLQVVASAKPEEFASALGTCAVQAAVRGFGFLLRSNPELAVPLDARAQALRAAVALDAGAVRVMLQEQVLPRLEVSLQGSLLTAQCQGACMQATMPSPRTIDEDMLAVLESLQSTLLEAVDTLQAGLTSDMAADYS